MKSLLSVSSLSLRPRALPTSSKPLPTLFNTPRHSRPILQLKHTPIFSILHLHTHTHTQMASSALTHALFSPLTSHSPISNRTLLTPSLALPPKQFGSPVLSTHSNLTHKAFIVNCTPPEKGAINQELPIELSECAYTHIYNFDLVFFQ